MIERRASRGRMVSFALRPSSEVSRIAALSAAAKIADECFAWLDAPVKRVASADAFVGYAPSLEDATLPQVETFRTAYLDIVRY
jgi:pyruvate/2-oxoglutarate/acetoin dehydrogenase E1 component